MKIRITATEEDAAQVAADLQSALTSGSGSYVVRAVSGFYRNRTDSNLGRTYLDIDLVSALGGAA